MNLQGDFEGQALSTILQMLCDEQQTGLLQVTNNGDKSRVFFQDGTIIYAISSHKETKLGALLLRGGVITTNQLQSCLKIASEKKEFLGKVLIEQGCISSEQLKEYSQKQVEDILYNLLFWKNGKFQYKSGKLQMGNMIVSNLVPMKVIMEVARRIDEMSIIKEMIPDENVIFKPSTRMTSLAEDVKLTPVEWRLISLVDGKRSLKQLVDESNYALFDTYKILFSATMSGVIEIAEQDESCAEQELESIFPEISLEQEPDLFEDSGAQVQEPSEDQSDKTDDVGIDEETALFLEEIKKALTVAVGPVASIIMKDQFSEWIRQGDPVFSRTPELFELLTKEIDDENLAEDFAQSALKLYENFSQPAQKKESPEKDQEASVSKKVDVKLSEESGEILKEIQDALSHAIGPVAGLVLEDSMKRIGSSGSLSKEQLCDLANILKEEIGDDKLAEEFSNRLSDCF